MYFITSQENVKTKHPQLLYEAKLYRILQGGSKIMLSVSDILKLHLVTCYFSISDDLLRYGHWNFLLQLGFQILDGLV